MKTMSTTLTKTAPAHAGVNFTATVRRVPVLACFLSCLSLPIISHAEATLRTYELGYEARYQGMRAGGDRILTRDDNGDYHMHAEVALTLLGKTVFGIRETSYFQYGDNGVIPLSYEYRQTGLGSRRRGVIFDWVQGIAHAYVNDNRVELPLEPGVVDEYTAFVAAARQLQAGAEEVFVQTVDDDRIRELHFRVVGHETLETPVGAIDTLRLERVRDPGSRRHTEFWLARDWDMALVRLVQQDSRGRTLELNLRSASFDGESP